LEDGKKLKMLKRYLRSRYDLSPEEYRRRWGLPPEYPMVAPAYAARQGVIEGGASHWFEVGAGGRRSSSSSQALCLGYISAD
ncbi:MAG: MucR family transcriptional regulator, partial [Caulobacteraceae bacterium]|nr:MucR family transcriptional regulator [Caulobacteraceae bacterium]